jgi:outer membrane protein OmpA-like peptidoglycan-associated protein
MMKALSTFIWLLAFLSALLLGVAGCRFPAGSSSRMRTLVLPGQRAATLFILINHRSVAAMQATEAFAAESARPGERLVVLSARGGAILASSVAPPAPSARIQAPPAPLGSDPTAFQKARHNQALRQYQNTVRRTWAALRVRQQEVLAAWARSTVARAFARPVLQSAGNVSINDDLGAVAADESSLRQAGTGDSAATVIAITGITAAIAHVAPALPIALPATTVVVDDFPGSISEEAAWQVSLLQSGAARVVLLTPATDDRMATVIDEGLDDAVTDTLTSLLFRPGQYSIQAAALPQLAHLLRLLTGTYRRATITINGYTDSLPAAIPGGNLQLSRLRAEQVEQWLIAHKVAADRIQAFGYGDTDPVAPNTPNGQPLNRRVVVVIDPATAAGAS